MYDLYSEDSSKKSTTSKKNSTTSKKSSTTSKTPTTSAPEEVEYTIAIPREKLVLGFSFGPKKETQKHFYFDQFDKINWSLRF